LLFITALATSFLSALVFFLAINESFSGQGFWMLLFAVLSALAAVALHRPAINHVLQTQKIDNDV
jgi:apolipoprotein N-acyltransferase